MRESGANGCHTAGGERPIWTTIEGVGTRVESVIPTIERWLRECDETHGESCAFEHGTGEPILPARCIDLGETMKGSLEPRLVIGGGRSARYMTLSHCWGKEVPVRTTRANIDEMATAIRLDELPKTYRDAIAITRSLGIRYLWIDSICIIQGKRHQTRHHTRHLHSSRTNTSQTTGPTGNANPETWPPSTETPTSTSPQLPPQTAPAAAFSLARPQRPSKSPPNVATSLPTRPHRRHKPAHSPPP